ncbi:MAG TPA: hypothetical protein VM600_08255, partial [Actinomycetota bacterium]|nr:hypothetical protein [Actinomycetota bacterium]
ADEREEIARAVRSLHGYASGFAPPFALRAKTNSRTPEGILYEVNAGSFVARGGFRRDTF